MGTRALIGIINHSETVHATNVHDGEINSAGRMLARHYRDEQKVKELISLGHYGISSIGKEIGEKHRWDEQREEFCSFYGRDRGEKRYVSFTKYDSVKEFLYEAGNWDYLYLFNPKDNSWTAFKYGDRDNGPKEVPIPGNRAHNKYDAMFEGKKHPLTENYERFFKKTIVR